jgi:hypothetical protein
MRGSVNRLLVTVSVPSLEQLQHLTDTTWVPLALDEQRVQMLVRKLCTELEPPKYWGVCCSWWSIAGSKIAGRFHLFLLHSATFGVVLPASDR